MSASTRVAAAGPLRVGIAMLLITVFAWGLNWPLMKVMFTYMPPFSIRAVSGFLGAGAAAGIAAWRGERLLPPAGQWVPLISSAMLNFASFMFFATVALLWLDASEAVIIAYTLPIWAALFAWPVLGERLTARRLLALCAGMGGVVILMAGEPLNVSTEKLPGVAAALAAAILFALGTVLAKRRPLRMPPVAAVAWQAGLGTLPMLPPAILLEHPVWSSAPAIVWFCVAWMALMGLCVAYLAWFRALAILAASTAAIGALLVPVVGVFSSALILHEPLGPRQLLALGLTIAGVVLAVRG